MTVVCMFCKRYISTKPWHGSKLNKSHGICDKCLRKEYPELAEELLKKEEENDDSKK